jgi:hypothetical protein
VGWGLWAVRGSEFKWVRLLLQTERLGVTTISCFLSLFKDPGRTR